MKQISLTKSEKEIMALLWNTDRPLTATEIVNMTPERTWKKSYIHLLINSLIKKELIRSDALVRTGRNFGRTFIATMTEEEFTIRQITGNKNFSQKSVPSLVSALLDTCSTPEVLSELDLLLQKKKEEISAHSTTG